MGKVDSPAVLAAKKLSVLDPKNRPGTLAKLKSWLGRLASHSTVVTTSIPHTAAILQQAFNSGKNPKTGSDILPAEAVAATPLSERLGAKDASTLETLVAILGSDKAEDPNAKELAFRVLEKWSTAQQAGEPVELGKLLFSTHLTKKLSVSELVGECESKGFFGQQADGSIKYNEETLKSFIEKENTSCSEGTDNKSEEKSKSEGYFSVEFPSHLAQGSVVLQILKKQEIKKLVKDICPHLKLERASAQFNKDKYVIETALQPPDALLVQHVKDKVQQNIEGWLPPPLVFELKPGKVDGCDVMRVQEATKCRVSVDGQTVRFVKPADCKVSDEVLGKLVEAHLQPTAWREIGEVQGKKNISHLVGKRGRALKVFERKANVQVRFRLTSPADAPDEEVTVAVSMKLTPTSSAPRLLMQDSIWQQEQAQRVEQNAPSRWMVDYYETEPWWRVVNAEWDKWSVGMQEKDQRKALLR
mmetsp:Transcript_36442/g.77504  ORF Transcript_36442/g.77504 Transcript_36442/m.77504 type:complete len:473 (+) Transcript_36442:195-1613(+)